MDIKHGDWPGRVTEPSELEGILNMIKSTGPWIDTILGDSAQCYVWPFEAAERYEGDFTAATKNPVLFVNPTFDPVTPLASATNASSGFEGSVVPEHRGHGHGVLTQPSLCTARYMRDYMVDGTLPEADTVCEPDMELFAGAGVKEFAQMREEVFKDLIDGAGAVKISAKDSEGKGGLAEGETGSTTQSDTSSAPILKSRVVNSAGLAAVAAVAVIAT